MGEPMRERLTFVCEGAKCAASWDHGARSDVGLLIVSGGNETLAGAHRGMAWLAQELARQGYNVMRYDRRGVGDSEGDNLGFQRSGSDIAAATDAFRRASSVQNIAAFGNCDAATALVLHRARHGIDRLILANPWTFDDEGTEDAMRAETAQPTTLPPASAIRARYLARLKDPRQIWRLVSGGVDIRKLLSGLRAAGGSTQTQAEGLGAELRNALLKLDIPASILLAKHDRTAMAFADIWTKVPTKDRQHIPVHSCDTPSHGFADDVARIWLRDQISAALG
jgi:exosortase A-associated hydrolase 1